MFLGVKKFFVPPGNEIDLIELKISYVESENLGNGERIPGNAFPGSRLFG